MNMQPLHRARPPHCSAGAPHLASRTTHASVGGESCHGSAQATAIAVAQGGCVTGRGHLLDSLHLQLATCRRIRGAKHWACAHSEGQPDSPLRWAGPWLFRRVCELPGQRRLALTRRGDDIRRSQGAHKRGECVSFVLQTTVYQWALPTGRQLSQRASEGMAAVYQSLATAQPCIAVLSQQ